MDLLLETLICRRCPERIERHDSDERDEGKGVETKRETWKAVIPELMGEGRHPLPQGLSREDENMPDN